MKKALIFLITIIFLSCSSPTNSSFSEVKFVEDDVKEISLLKSTDISSILDSTTASFHVLSIDNKLILNEIGPKGLLHIINLEGEKYRGLFGEKGFGVGEMGMPRHLALDNNSKLQVLDPQQKNVVLFNPSSQEKGLEFLKEYSLKKIPGIRAGLVIDDTVYGLNHIRSKNRIYAADLDGNIIEGIGKMPDNDKKFPDHVFAEAHDAHIRFHDKHFAVAYKTTPVVQIINKENGTEIYIQGPEDFPSNFMENSNDYMAMAYTKDTRMGYLDIKIGDKYIYGLYGGKKVFDPTSALSKTIYVFDYNGKVLKKLELDESVHSFAVHKDSVIYGIQMGMKAKLLKFDI